MLAIKIGYTFCVMHHVKTEGSALVGAPVSPGTEVDRSHPGDLDEGSQAANRKPARRRTASRAMRSAVERPRRRKGEGSVFQQDDGRWVAEISAGMLPDGRRNRPRVYCMTEDEAVDALLTLRQDKKDGKFANTERPPSGADVLVNDWLDTWLKRVKADAPPKTHKHYKNSVEKLKPGWRWARWTWSAAAPCGMR